MKNMSIKATVATKIINIPLGVVKWMTLSQICVPFVELVGVVLGAEE